MTAGMAGEVWVTGGGALVGGLNNTSGSPLHPSSSSAARTPWPASMHQRGNEPLELPQQRSSEIHTMPHRSSRHGALRLASEIPGQTPAPFAPRRRCLFICARTLPELQELRLMQHLLSTMFCLDCTIGTG